MMRTEMNHGLGEYLTELMRAELSHYLGWEPYERKEGDALEKKTYRKSSLSSADLPKSPFSGIHTK
jgi:hypothetical protein